MYFVEIEVMPGQWRVLSTNWSKTGAHRETSLLRIYSPFCKRLPLRVNRFMFKGSRP